VAVYIFLCVAAFAGVILGFVRPLFRELVRIADKSSSNGVKGNLFAFTIMCVFTCAWVTDILGVHAMFGAFIFGLAMPRNGRFAIEIAEKIEEVVRTVLLPLYFAKSGLLTDVRTINSPQSVGLMVRKSCGSDLHMSIWFVLRRCW
jgi:Kef-type K+ transport system membrane component KefB